MGGILLPIIGELAQQGGAIAPDKIPNLSLWYDPDANTAAKVTLNNSNEVTQVLDLSGLGHPANSFGSSYPDYITGVWNGLSAPRFTAANNDNLDINPIAWAQSLSGFTIFSILYPTSFGASAFPLTNTDGGLGVQWNGTALQIGGGGGTATPTTPIVNDTTRPHIYAVIFDGTQTGDANRLKFRYDRQQIPLTFTASPGTATSSTAKTFFFCGNNRTNPKGYMNGYLLEVMMWTRALNTSEINGTETYIRQHWAI